MIVYYFFFGFLILGAIVTPKKETKVFLVSLSLLIWLMIGLRSTAVGADTHSYVENFVEYSKMSFSDMWRAAINYKEPLFIIITWLSSLISNNYSVFLLVWALFPAISLYCIFRDELYEKNDYVIAFMVFFLLGLFAFYVAGIRQTAALSFVLLSYKYIKNKKLLRFIICIAIAFLFHRSSLIFVIAYPLRHIKIRWWYVFFLIGIFFLGSFINLDVISLFSKTLFDDVYENYALGYESNQSASAFIMQLLLFLFCFIKLKPLSQKDKSNHILFVLAIVGLFFQSLSGMLAEMSRVSFYFCMFQMVLVARAIHEYKFKKVIYPVFILFAIIYLFSINYTNLPRYSFASLF